MASQDRRYWVVSPNVRNNEGTVAAWRQASVRGRAAFMGYWPDDIRHNQTGHKFAHVIKPKDVILIARRRNHKAEIVGFGIVRGGPQKAIGGLKTPDTFGSLRRLSPFIPLSGPTPRIPFIAALRHTKALVQLHPDWNKAHRVVCDWMEQILGRTLAGGGNYRRAVGPEKNPKAAPGVRSAAPPGNHQLDYEVRTRKQVIRAQKTEAKLLEQYRRWLERQGRELLIVKYKHLECDGYEKDRRNLIEAKSPCCREYVRMAVGQLLDYSFQGRQKFGALKMAVLLPKEPDPNCVEWLAPLKISIVWKEKSDFLDNANGQFA